MVKRRNRRRRATGRRQIRGTVSETIITSVKPGINTVTASHLTNTPQNSSWRIVSTRAQLTYSVGTSTPFAIQCVMFNPTGQAVAASGVKLLGNVARTISTRYPANAEWFSPLSLDQPKTPVYQIDVVCTGGSASSDIRIGCVITMRVATKQEVVGTTCPPKSLEHREHVNATSSERNSQLSVDDAASSFSSLEITNHQEVI